MSGKWRVQIEGGAYEDLYVIRTAGDSYEVHKTNDVNLLSPNDEEYIGEAESLEDAIGLIKSDSGEDIKQIIED